MLPVSQPSDAVHITTRGAALRLESSPLCAADLQCMYLCRLRARSYGECNRCKQPQSDATWGCALVHVNPYPRMMRCLTKPTITPSCSNYQFCVRNPCFSHCTNCLLALPSTSDRTLRQPRVHAREAQEATSIDPRRLERHPV